MSKRLFSIVVAVVFATALVIPAVVVSADTATATRTLPASVDAGANFDVGIVASGCGAMGQVVETLPTGFSYVGTTSTDVNVSTEDNVVKFTFIGDAVTFDYTVAASSTEGTYSFAGVVKDDDLAESAVGGDTAITVGAPAETSATRTLPASVDAGANFDVGIVASGCGQMGEVAETLPTGFSYVGTTSTNVFVTQEDSVVRFSFIGDAVSFDYTVAASSTEGTYSFSGVVKDADLIEYPVGGDTAITVGAPPATSATRTLPASVDAGANFDVGIDASGCGQLGEVAETLPSGFSYVGTTSTDVIVTQEDSVVRFSFIGDGVSFDYTVAASTTEGTYSFAGVVKDEDLNEYPIGGDTQVEVTTPAPEEPELVELEFTGSLTKGERETLLTPDIPAGVIDLAITLMATADIDLELYDGATFVIGWKGLCDSKVATTYTYEGDDFAYSGYADGDEYITADGPLSRAYTLGVFGYKAGNYEVRVSYTVPVGVDLTPPEITITAPDGTVGSPVTITVSATDPSGVASMGFGVWPAEYVLTGALADYNYAIAMAGGPGGEVSITFTPSSANSYYVAAWAVDMVGNATPDLAPVTATWVVTE